MSKSKSAVEVEQQTSSCRAVTVWNDSGGVGKTTVSVNVSAELGRAGENVLAIDLDPQAGGLTDHAGFDGVLNHSYYNLVDSLVYQKRSLNEFIIDGADHGLSWDIIPAHNALSELGETAAVNIVEGNISMLLRYAIQDAGLHTNYDAIIVDAPATRGKVVENAVAATRNVLIPTELSRKGVSSVNGLQNFVLQLQQQLRQTESADITLGIIGVVANNCAKNGRLTNTEAEALGQLLNDDSKPVVPFYIPSRTGLTDAWMNRQSLYEFAETDATRDMRQNEQILGEMFSCLATVVREGGVDALDDAQIEVPDNFETAVLADDVQ